MMSIPSMLVEMGEEDVKAFERYSKMLERVGRPILIAAESETAEIIRRRLFDWKPEQLSQTGKVLLSSQAEATCQAYAAWIRTHRAQLPTWFSCDHAEQVFMDTYPFHPSVFSVFERKWQALPRFQRTRGILRLLALWTLQRRYNVEESQIQKRIEGMIAISEIIPLTLADYQEARDLREQYARSFWDSLIVAVALRADCEVLYSEDRQHDLVIQGRLRIQNPLR